MVWSRAGRGQDGAWNDEGSALALPSDPSPDGWGYLVKENLARWVVPSASITVSNRAVPAQALSVFQT